MKVFLKALFLISLTLTGGGYAKTAVLQNEGSLVSKEGDLPANVLDKKADNLEKDSLMEPQGYGDMEHDLGHVEYRKQTTARFMNRESALRYVLPQTRPVTNCVTLIATNGVKRAFPKCKTHKKKAMAFCRSAAGKKSHKTVCKKMLVSNSIEVSICELQAKKFKKPSELCTAIVPKKKSKADCKADQLFAPLPGGSSEPVCIDAPLKTRSKTQTLPLGLYEHWPKKPNSKLATEQMNVIVNTIPIGQGDCNIITCNSGKNVIVFDCGSSAGNIFKVPPHSNFIMKYFYYAEAVTVLVSHGHNDHWSYIPLIVDFLASKTKKPSLQVLTGGPDSDYNANFVNKLKAFPATKVTSYNFCDNTDIHFNFLFSDHKYGNPNQRGMLMKLSCSTCNSNLLFTGDMEGPAAEEFAKSNAAFLDSTHYKMAHHGASTLANKPNWLMAISPVEVHVSHVFRGRYEHPRCEAVGLIVALDTVGATTTPPHALTCYDSGVENTQLIRHRFYSTAPTLGVLCLIKLTFNAGGEATTEYYCGPPSNFV